MATRRVFHTIRKPDGSPWTDASIRFVLVEGSYTTEAWYPKATVEVDTNREGRFEIDLWPNEEGAVSSHYLCYLPGEKEPYHFTLPVGEEPIPLPVLIEGGVTEKDPQYQTLLTWVESNPTLRGPEGPQGPPPTPEQISAEVAAQMPLLIEEAVAAGDTQVERIQAEGATVVQATQQARSGAESARDAAVTARTEAQATLHVQFTDVAASRPLNTTDVSRYLWCSSEESMILTIPADLDWPNGGVCIVMQGGQGWVYVEAEEGVTLVAQGERTRTTGSSATVMRRSATEYVLVGDVV
jgi:hypothetical protein